MIPRWFKCIHPLIRSAAIIAKNTFSSQVTIQCKNGSLWCCFHFWSFLVYILQHLFVLFFDLGNLIEMKKSCSVRYINRSDNSQALWVRLGCTTAKNISSFTFIKGLRREPPLTERFELSSSRFFTVSTAGYRRAGCRSNSKLKSIFGNDLILWLSIVYCSNCLLRVQKMISEWMVSDSKAYESISRPVAQL